MSIFSRYKSKLISKGFEGNIFLGYIARNEFRLGHTIKAALLSLYTRPLRKILTVRNAFITAPKEYYTELHSLLRVAKPEGKELVRIGRDYDGGYIMPDDFGDDDKIAYSFGISDDVSWDKCMAAKGYDVFMYDHTIDALPEENEHFHWHKLGISDGTDPDERLKSLEELIAINHHEGKRNMILKMDVEGAEWGFLERVKPEILSQFSQILIEFHDINAPKNTGRILPVLRKLNQTHQPVHIHGQNNGYCVSLGTHTFCNQIEVSYVRRDKYILDENYDIILPLEIDMPAHENVPEVCLGHWNRDILPDAEFSSVTVIL